MPRGSAEIWKSRLGWLWYNWRCDPRATESFLHSLLVTSASALFKSLAHTGPGTLTSELGSQEPVGLRHSMISIIPNSTAVELLPLKTLARRLKQLAFVSEDATRHSKKERAGVASVRYDQSESRWWSTSQFCCYNSKILRFALVCLTVVVSFLSPSFGTFEMKTRKIQLCMVLEICAALLLKKHVNCWLLPWLFLFLHSLRPLRSSTTSLKNKRGTW